MIVHLEGDHRIEWVPPGAGCVCAKCGGHAGNCLQVLGLSICKGCLNAFVDDWLKEQDKRDWLPSTIHEHSFSKHRRLLDRWVAGQWPEPTVAPQESYEPCEEPIAFKFGFQVDPMEDRCLGASIAFEPKPWVLIEFWKWDIRFGWIPT